MVSALMLFSVQAKVRVFQEDAKKEVLVLAKRLADADSRRHAMSDKLAVMEERLDDGHQTIASLFGRLATTSKELIDQTAMTAVLSKSVEDITAELDAANTKFQASNEEVAARDKMIAHQRLEIVEGRQLVAVLSHANGVLGCMLAKTQTQLKARANFRRGHVSLLSWARRLAFTSSKASTAHVGRCHEDGMHTVRFIDP